MTDHLPECPMSILPQPTFDYVTTTWPDGQVKEVKWECICPLLRACELRVLRKEYELDEGDPYREVYRGGYAAALDAAEAAVRSESRSKENGTYNRDEDWDNAIDDAVAAIRALKEKP